MDRLHVNRNVTKYAKMSIKLKKLHLKLLKRHKINYRNSDDKCLIYVLICKKCFKGSAGETTEVLVKVGTTIKIMSGNF